MAAGATYEPIATSSPSGTGTVTFSSLGSYTDLRLIILSTSSTGTSAVRLRFNSDTGSNYSQTNLYGDGTGVYSDRLTSQTLITILGNTGGMSSTIPALIQTDIFSYGGSTNKTILSRTSNDKNSTDSRIENVVGLWRSTNAITSITISTNSGNYTNATFSLYGIKAA